MERLLAIGDVRDLKGVRICTVGPSTAGAARRGSAFASTSRRRSIAPKRWSRSFSELGALDGVAVPAPARGHRARAAGATSCATRAPKSLEVVAYRTVVGGAEREEADIYRMLLDRQIDAVTFTSASTVRNFVSILGPDQAADLLRTTVVACIGPVTAEAAQQLGIATTVMPERYTIPDLVDALVEHFGKK